jgi:hypothetical protein
VKEKLIPNLPAESVAVIDNAPYHNIKINKIPASNSTKKEMRQWILTNSVVQEPEGSSLHSQQPATGPCPETVESNPHPPTQSP